jgi:hypothetical protein
MDCALHNTVQQGGWSGEVLSGASVVVKLGISAFQAAVSDQFNLAGKD